MGQQADEAQKEKLQQLLDNDINLRSYGLSADVVDGQAQLTGVVDTLSEKQHAERLALSLPGVRSVDAGIAVSTDGSITDADVTKEVREELGADPHVDLRHIGVETSGGKVILKGRATETEVEAARRSVAKARGVTQVVSQVKTKPRERTLEEIFHSQVQNDQE
ncbi:MAG: BON domain-containing protein [Bacillota bacterium]